MGESQGSCSHTDFSTELSGYQSAFDSIYKCDFIDTDRIFVVGLSNGGGTSVLVPRQHKARDYIAASSWGRTWYEQMLEMERLRLINAGKSAAEVGSQMKAFSQFYDLYLNQGLAPGGKSSRNLQNGRRSGTTNPMANTVVRQLSTNNCRASILGKRGKRSTCQF